MPSALSFSSRGLAPAADPARKTEKIFLKTISKFTCTNTCQKVCPKPPKGSQVAPKSLSRRPFGAPWEAQPSKKHEKPEENLCFYDIHKVALGRPSAPHLAPQVLRMRSQMAQKEPKGPKRSPFATPFCATFRIKTIKNRYWGPECPQGHSRHPKCTNK